jgi:hypothetical protein
MKKFFLDMFSSSEGVSHKRVLGAIGFIALVVAMFISESERVIEAVEFCTIAYGLGSVAEKFSSRYGSKEGQSAE